MRLAMIADICLTFWIGALSTHWLGLWLALSIFAGWLLFTLGWRLACEKKIREWERRASQ